MTQKESRPFNWYAIMTVVGFFQIITGFTVLLQKDEFDWILAAVLLGYIFIEYIYFFVAAVLAVMNARAFEIKPIAQSPSFTSCSADRGNIRS